MGIDVLENPDRTDYRGDLLHASKSQPILRRTNSMPILNKKKR